MSPPRITKFKNVFVDQQEAIYGSKKKAPLGSAHTRGPGLPNGVDPLATSFGQKNVKTEGAGDMIRPQKTTVEVEQEFHAGRELYKKVHVYTLFFPIDFALKYSWGLPSNFFRKFSRMHVHVLLHMLSAPQCAVNKPVIVI